MLQPLVEKSSCPVHSDSVDAQRFQTPSSNVEFREPPALPRKTSGVPRARRAGGLSARGWGSLRRALRSSVEKRAWYAFCHFRRGYAIAANIARVRRATRTDKLGLMHSVHHGAPEVMSGAPKRSVTLETRCSRESGRRLENRSGLTTREPAVGRFALDIGQIGRRYWRPDVFPRRRRAGATECVVKTTNGYRPAWLAARLTAARLTAIGPRLRLSVSRPRLTVADQLSADQPSAGTGIALCRQPLAGTVQRPKVP